MEIDYDKLAQAIIKAMDERDAKAQWEVRHDPSPQTKALGGWEPISLVRDANGYDWVTYRRRLR